MSKIQMGIIKTFFYIALRESLLNRAVCLLSNSDLFSPWTILEEFKGNPHACVGNTYHFHDVADFTHTPDFGAQ